MTAGCTNPGGARRRQGEARFLLVHPGAAAAGSASRSPGRRQGRPPTPFLRTEGLVTADCVHDGQAGYLAVTVNADPNDARTDRIPGDVYIGGQAQRPAGASTSST